MELDGVFSLFQRLAERRGQRAITVSGGEQSILSIGCALIMNPDLLLFDEPTDGLAPLKVDQVAATVETPKREQQTILLVEQDLAPALDLSDYVGQRENRVQRQPGGLARETRNTIQVFRRLILSEVGSCPP